MRRLRIFSLTFAALGCIFGHVKRHRRLGGDPPVRTQCLFFYFLGKEVSVMTTVPEYFGSLVFDTRVMKARLSADVYRSLKQTIQKGAKLDPTVADAVASAMKDWAV